MEHQIKPVRILIRTENNVYQAMLEAEKMARNIGFDPANTIRIKTTVSELGRNILKYAEKGFVSLSHLVDGKKEGIGIEVIDKGPGIENIELAISDSYSTGGTLGLGLPGVKRMMDKFEIESIPGSGTRVYVVKWK
ncbi:MAG: hypothetical protein EP344_19500 [Bacteroidetes bacterium]|nr:MAG: hypothetical protein EP344_19500 [Bacteroidota bacterium]